MHLDQRRRSAPRLLLRPGKTGNWQPGNWSGAEHLDKLALKRPQERGEKTCGQSESWKATELVGAAAGVCCLSTALQITPQQYHTSRQLEARTSENYRTPLARDNPSIRGGAGWCLGLSLSLQTMPDGGGGRNLKQPDMPPCLWSDHLGG